MPRYYYLLDDVVHGPVEVQDLKRRFVSGEVDQAAAYVRREDRKDWVPAARLRFKSDPRLKSKSSPFSLESDVELEDLVDLEEIEEEAAEVPLDRVRFESEKPQTKEKRSFALWSPSWASFLSIPFSSAFGAYVHSKNWEILGDHEKAAINKVFFWVASGSYFLQILFAFLSGVNSTFGRISFVFSFTTVVLLIVWYFVLGRSQSKYVDQHFPMGYRRIPWPNSWMNIAGFVLLLQIASQCFLQMKTGAVKFDLASFISNESGSLVGARRLVRSTFRGEVIPKTPPSAPPAGVFQLVKYSSSVGKLSAYVTPDPGDGKKHPAIVWITGGDSNSIDRVWEPATPDNDQTAAAYRNAGIVMMFPSLRGGNDNPGERECFLGEVDDVVSASKYLASLPYVDSSRVYLGGHSTGGTMALLVSECTSRFRAVFAFGPVEDIRGYGHFVKGIDRLSPQEIKIRSPYYWLNEIKTPTFVIEGGSNGNIESLLRMARATKNPQIHFDPVPGNNHFDVLAPCNEFIAKKIDEDTGIGCSISLTTQELVEYCSHNRMQRDKAEWEQEMARQQQAMMNNMRATGHVPSTMSPNGFPPQSRPPNFPPQNSAIPPGYNSPPNFPGLPPPSQASKPVQPPPQQPKAEPVSNPAIAKQNKTKPAVEPGEPEESPPAKPPVVASRPKAAEPQPELFKPSALSKDEQVKQMCDELNGLEKTNRTRLKELIDELSKTKDERAIRPIVRRVADSYPGAERALAPFGTDAEKVILDELKTAEDIEYIRRLADALGTVGTKESIGVLRKLSKHESKFVRLSAESSLTEIRRRGL